MAEVLTQKQIDELLGNLKSGEMDMGKAEEEKTAKAYKEYDFSTPKRITRERTKLLDSIFENFARLFALQISSMVRTACEAEVVALEEQQYFEFSNALNDSVLIGTFDLRRDESIHDEDKQMLMEVSRPLSYCIMDRLLGGSGDGHEVDKEYTDIELALMEYLFQKISMVYSNAWSNYVDVQAVYSMIETNSRLIQSIAPDETIVIIVIEVTLKSLKEKINICIPADSLDMIFKSFDTKFARVSKRGDSESEKKRRDYIMESLTDTPLTVTGILGNTEISLQDLLSLQVGDIMTLDTSTHGDSIKVNVDDAPWFTSVLGVKNKKYAVRVATILNDE